MLAFYYCCHIYAYLYSAFFTSRLVRDHSYYSQLNLSLSPCSLSLSLPTLPTARSVARDWLRPVITVEAGRLSVSKFRIRSARPASKPKSRAIMETGNASTLVSVGVGSRSVLDRDANPQPMKSELLARARRPRRLLHRARHPHGYLKHPRSCHHQLHQAIACNLSQATSCITLC